MKPIQMVDLKSQYLKIKPEIDRKLDAVFDSTAFINGSFVKDFQSNLEKYLGIEHVIPCGNGTDALQIALMALDLEPGDEVITTPFTFIATAEVIALLGLVPVFVDCRYDTFNMDVTKIEKAITPKSKVILPVHLFGQCCDMEEIVSIATDYNLYVIEDACQSIGSEYTDLSGKTRKAGTLGDIGCTSFFPSKNLGCYGDGGAVFTRDEKLAHKMRGIANHGMFTRYYHEMIGVNSRLDTIQAAVLDVKLQYLDQYNAARQQAAACYDKAFKGHSNIETPVISPYSSHVFHQYTVKLNNVDRIGLTEGMKEAGIPVMIYYPVPLHLQKAFEYLGKKRGDFPVAEMLCDRVISLPMHTELSLDQLDYITSQFLKLI